MTDRSPYRSARIRVTVVSAVVVFVVLALAGWAVTVAHHRALRNSLEETLERASDDLADAVAAGGPITTIGFGDDDAAYQVVDADGRVLASSANLEGAPSIGPAPDGGDEDLRAVEGLGDDSESFLLRSEAVDGGLVIHVAVPLDDIEESTSALRRAFVVAVPLTTAVLAAALWYLVGRLLRRAEAASSRQQRFVADASHELRSPLTRMRTELEVDLAHPGRAEPLATHRLVLDETLGLQRLVDDLLQLARLDDDDGGTTPARTAVVDLDAIVSRVAGDLRAAGGVEVDTSAVGSLQVVGQADQLRRAVANLADNAARFARTTVRFELGERHGQVVLGVVDDGPGIPPADRERVFERFSRVDDARGAAGGGTGLGLAITREIVGRHGGTVHVDPDHSPGARFVVLLPVA